MHQPSSSLHHLLPGIALDWVNVPAVDATTDSGSAGLSRRVDEVRELATRSGRLTAARLADTLILAAPHQEAAEVTLLSDLAEQEMPEELFRFVDLAHLPWESVPCWHQAHKHYRFEQRILRLDPEVKMLALTRDGELTAIATPAELRSEKGCAVLQIRCFRDEAIDQVSYFFAFGERSFCEAEGNPWKTRPHSSPLGEDIREIIKHPARHAPVLPR